MIIRKSQMSVLALEAERAFVSQVMSYLREHHAAAVEGLSDGTLRARTVFAIERGRSHGFMTMLALAAFTALMFELGPDFDTHPAFRAALRIDLPDEPMRIKAIYSNVTDEDWQEAHDQSNLELWPADLTDEAS